MTSPSEMTLVFSYDDDKQSIVVEQRFSEAQTLMRQGLINMIEAGGKFAEIRELLSHNRQGGFDGWIETKQLGRTTVYRLIDLHRAFATVPHMGRLDIAATAAYLLAAPSVPEAARAEAIQRAQAGERITVPAAKDIIDRQYVSGPELVPGVRAWLESVPSYRNNPGAQRDVLNQIKIQSPVGRDHLAKLMAFPGLATPNRASDLVSACRYAFDDINAEAMQRVAKVVVVEPSPESTHRAPIYELERALKLWLKQFCASPGEERVILEDIKAKREPWYGRVFAASTLPPNRTNGDVLQAAHNLLDHLDQADARAASAHTVTTGSVPPAPSGPAVTIQTSGRCQKCGRPLTDPDHVAAGCGPICAAKAAGNGSASARAQSIQSGPSSQDLPAIVEAWLVRKVEDNDLPDDHSAHVFVLTQVINNRSAGGAAEIWKDLRSFEKWPAGTTNDDKLTACRIVLARLTGRPVDPAPAAEPTPRPLRPIELDVPPSERDQRRIRQLETALRTLIDFVKSRPMAADLEPETAAVLQAASTALHDQTWA